MRVNKKRTKPDYKIKAGDAIRIPPVKVSPKPELPSPKLAKVAELEQAIVYEDDAFMIVNKPSGLAVHGGSGLNFGLIEGLRALQVVSLRVNSAAPLSEAIVLYNTSCGMGEAGTPCAEPLSSAELTIHAYPPPSCDERCPWVWLWWRCRW